MSFKIKPDLFYISERDRKTWAAEMPIGDPCGGPAYGEKTDVGSVLSIGGSILGGIMGDDEQSSAVSSASDSQVQAAKLGIDEQKRQFDLIQTLLKPYIDAGSSSINSQKDLLGLNGQQAQQNAINNVQSNPYFTGLVQQGENGILQNASATGGLRGGNTQAALAQFRPQMLNQLIQQQFSNLGGLSSIGQNAAAGVGNAGMQSANSIGNLMQQQGAAQAGAALAQGQLAANQWGGLGNIVGQIGGLVSGGGGLGKLLGSIF